MNLELFSPVFVYFGIVSGQTLAGILGKSVDFFWTCFHNHGLGSECPNIELVLRFPSKAKLTD